MRKVYHDANDPSILLLKCSKCGAKKPLDDFSFDNRRPHGRQSQCRQCDCELHRTKGRIKPPQQLSLSFFKVCTKCEKEKSTGDFSLKGDSKDGFDTICKECDAEIGRVRRQSPGFDDHKNQWHKQHYGIHPEVAERERARSRAWQKDNPLKSREQGNRRRSCKQHAQVGQVSYHRILERDGAWCYICEKDIDLTIKKGIARLVFDHVIPLTPRKGTSRMPGAHSEDNIRPTHKCCNNRKYNRLLEELSAWDRRGPDV